MACEPASVPNTHVATTWREKLERFRFQEVIDPDVARTQWMDICAVSAVELPTAIMVRPSTSPSPQPPPVEQSVVDEAPHTPSNVQEPETEEPTPTAEASESATVEQQVEEEGATTHEESSTNEEPCCTPGKNCKLIKQVLRCS